MHCAVSVSRHSDPALAAATLEAGIRQGLPGGRIDLAALFFTADYAEETAALVAGVQQSLGARVLIGCTGEGVIGGYEEIEDGPAAVLWAASLPGAALHPVRWSVDRDTDRYQMTNQPEAFGEIAEPPVVLLLADPFTAPMDEALAILSDRWPGFVAIGGLAGGGRESGGNRLVLNDAITDNGIVGVAVGGAVSMRTVVSQGCRPIGDRYVVTRAEQNIIHELGGRPALEQLQSVFEGLSERDREQAQRALHIGIVINEHRNRFERGDFLIRNLVGADRRTGSLAIGDLVREGQTVQFQVRDARSASEDLNVLLAADHTQQKGTAEGALLFSCCGRGRGMFGRAHHDIGVLRERMGDIPIAGFFAQGEIGPVGGETFLHGYTASVALFSERRGSHRA